MMATRGWSFSLRASLSARSLVGRLQRHVLVEFLRALALAAAVFTGFFMLMVALSLESQARRYGTDVATLAAAMPYFLPYVLCFSLPMAFLVAAVLAFGKLEGAGEMSAMRASGVRLTTVTGPVIALALASAVPIVFLTDTGMTWGFGRVKGQIEQSGRASILSRAGAGTTLKVDAGGRSFRIHRFGEGPDGRQPLAIVEFVDGAPREVVLARDHDLDAESGEAPARAVPGEAGVAMRRKSHADDDLDLLRFRIPAERGGGFAWSRISSPGEVFLARSGEFTIATQSTSKRRRIFGDREFAKGLSENVREAKALGAELGARRQEMLELDPDTRHRERARAALDARATGLRVVEMEIHRKLSFAFGPIALVLLGIPLGLRLGRGGRVAGFIVGIAVVALFYHPLWFSGQGLATAGVLRPCVSVWMANVAAGAVGAVWLSRTV